MFEMNYENDTGEMSLLDSELQCILTLKLFSTVLMGAHSYDICSFFSLTPAIYALFLQYS